MLHGPKGWLATSYTRALRVWQRGSLLFVPFGRELEFLGLPEYQQLTTPLSSKEEIFENWDLFCDHSLGGRSRAVMRPGPDGNSAIFTGVINTSTEGTKLLKSGYASIMHKPHLFDLADFDALRFRVKTDGRTYLANIKSADLTEDHMYQAVWTTEPGVWTDVTLRFEEFMPTYQGVLLRDIIPLNRTKLSSFGFLVADGRDGPFSLELECFGAANSLVLQRRYGRYLCDDDDFACSRTRNR